MTAMLSFAATSILFAVGVWVLGGLVLRISGVLLIAGGLLITAATGSLGSALLAVAGVLAWLVGHWLHAVRYHYYSSPLARRVFLEVLPPRFDPTRRWGIPNVPREGR
jgi:hypothetical membrane protein